MGPAYFQAHLPAHATCPNSLRMQVTPTVYLGTSMLGRIMRPPLVLSCIFAHVSSLCRCQRPRVQTASTSAHLLPSPATFQHVLMSLQAVGCHVRGVETVVFAAHIDQCMPTEFQWYHASPLSAHLSREKNATPEQSQYEPVFGCFRECKVKSFQLVGNRHPCVQQKNSISASGSKSSRKLNINT